jgi:hypothetical protein
MIERNEIGKASGDYHIFSDGVTFCVSGKVNKNNVRIWRTEQSHVTMQDIGDSPESLRVLCCVKDKSVCPLHFAEATITDTTCLDMLEQWLWAHIQEDFQGNLHFRQDGAVRDFLKKNQPEA